MNVHLVSLGCARNLVDSEGMMGRLRQAGWRMVESPEDAHVIVVNTCGFIEPAVNESIDTILEMGRFKGQGLCQSLVVAGCLPERFGRDLALELPEVDIFLGTGAFDRIVEAAEGKLKDSPCLFPDPEAPRSTGSDAGRVLTLPHTAYLKIAEGCSRNCTYCIIPKLRGRQRSRPAREIVAEAEGLIASGVKELVLVAQDSTAYARDLGQEKGLSRLLRELSSLSEAIWIRVLYGHPESIDESAIQAVSDLPNVCSYFDLPIQHASDSVLRRMGRQHSRKMLYDLFARIRAADPSACLRTTAIVGFPGETQGDFEELTNFIEEIRFDHLGVFVYSDADDLPSHRLSDPVPPQTAQRRRERLMARQKEISSQNNEKYLGKTLQVLVEELAEPGIFIGRAAFQAPEVDGVVYVHSRHLDIGTFTPAIITDTLEYDLVGEVR
jgi:ribosomal protein S12 methylthiotransferase